MNVVEDSSVFKERAHKVCQEFLGGAWKTISLEDLRFSVVRGGLSNKLFYCALPENCANSSDDIPKDALFRLYGPIHDGQDFRLQEIAIFTLLSERKLGPKLYGLFSDGRLEEYIPSRTLNFKELSTYSTSIAKEMAKVNALKLPVMKSPLFPRQPYEWLDFAKKNVDPNSTNPVEKMISSGEFKKELEWVISEIEKSCSPIVFCHNDLQGNNMLLLDSPKPGDRNLLFIDFEYGAYNYRGFDLANHFNQSCIEFGTKEDLTFYCVFHLENYPTKAQQIEFLNTYLNQLQKEGISLEHDLETETNKILREISISRMAVSLFWTSGLFKFRSVSTNNIRYEDFLQDAWKMYEMSKANYLNEYQTTKD